MERVETPIYDGERLLAGNRMVGPAIIEERMTTVVIPPGFDCSMDRFGSYVLTRSGDGH
jgi:N-methylhydantoinase A